MSDEENFEAVKKIVRTPFDMAQRADGGVGIASSTGEEGTQYFAQGTAKHNWVTIDTNLPPDVSMIITLDSLKDADPDQTIYLVAYNNGTVGGWVETNGDPNSRRELEPAMAKALYDFTDQNLHLPNSEQPYRQLTTTSLRGVESRAERAVSTAR